MTGSWENLPEASRIYDDSYFHGGEYFDYTAHQQAHERNAGFKWEVLTRLSPNPIRLLEVGCAYGYFVNYAKLHGAEKVFGTDVSQVAIDSALQQFGPHFSTGSADASDFNTLAMWDVLEHLPEPFSFLKAQVERLAVESLVGLTTVDAGSVVAKLRGRQWRQIHPPTHLNYPTRKALQIAAKNLNCEVLLQKNYSPFRALEVYFKAARLDWLNLPKNLRLFPMRLNLHDSQLLVLRKR